MMLKRQSIEHIIMGFFVVCLFFLLSSYYNMHRKCLSRTTTKTNFLTQFRDTQLIKHFFFSDTDSIYTVYAALMCLFIALTAVLLFCTLNSFLCNFFPCLSSLCHRGSFLLNKLWFGWSFLVLFSHMRTACIADFFMVYTRTMKN